MSRFNNTQKVLVLISMISFILFFVVSAVILQNEPLEGLGVLGAETSRGSVTNLETQKVYSINSNKEFSLSQSAYIVNSSETIHVYTDFVTMSMQGETTQFQDGQAIISTTEPTTILVQNELIAIIEAGVYIIDASNIEIYVVSGTVRQGKELYAVDNQKITKIVNRFVLSNESLEDYMQSKYDVLLQTLFKEGLLPESLIQITPLPGYLR